MVDNLLIQYEHEVTAREIFLLIGVVLQLKNEDKTLSFAYLGPCVNFNGVDIKQNNTHIMISCQSYIDRMLHAHGWDTPKSKQIKNCCPLPDSCLKTIFQ